MPSNDNKLLQFAKHRASIATALAVTVLVILGSAVLSYRNTRAQEDTAAVVIRTHMVIAALNQIETTMIDAETGQRGYLLTDKQEFLEPYLAATGIGSQNVPVIHRPPIHALLASLHRLPLNHGNEHALVNRIDLLVDEKLAELQQTIDLHRKGQQPQALEIVREGRGKRVMDALRLTLSNLRAEQRQQLEESEARRNQAARDAYLSNAASYVVSLLAIGLLVFAARRASRTILEEETRFHMLADNISQHAWALDAQGHFQWFNQRWRDYTGLDGEPDGQWSTASAHPLHRDRIQRGLAYAIAAGEHWEDIFPLRARDGHWHWFLVRATPIPGDDGKVMRWFGTNTNIDERLQLEQELIDGNRRKDEFIATLAHELRNPLAPVQAGLELMRINRAFPSQLVPTRDIMARQLKHLVRLIDDLLDVSRINSGKLELKRQPVDIRSVVDSALEISRLHIDSSGHTLDVCVPPVPLTVNGDAVRLAQVLSNLLNNGAKYTPQGGLIRLLAERHENEVAICVIDNGIGIDPAVLPDIFDLYSQANDGHERRQGGIGIGLSIARRLVEMHGGTLTAKSGGLGLGSTFTVRLPLIRAAPAVAQVAAVRDPPTGGMQRILILDDNIDAAQTLGQLLSFAGHTVELAHTGQDAIALAERMTPDIAFLDIGLPDMSGYDVARAIRGTPGLRGVRLVALTGWGAAADRAKSAEAGIDLHLTKPVSLSALSEVLPDLALPPARDAAADH